jgi:hypothetical protein
MTARLTAAQRAAIADIVRTVKRPPRDEHLLNELRDIAHATSSMATALGRDHSPLAERAERISAQVRALLAHVKQGEK